MQRKLWLETDWRKMNRVRLVQHLRGLSEAYEFSQPDLSDEAIKEYRAIYERAKEMGNDPYGVAGCIRPECLRGNGGKP